MAADQVALSEYRPVWLFAMFDVPVDTREQRRAYTKLRKGLLADGFTRLQYSVYARYCPSADASEVHRRQVECVLPPDGQVRLLSVTDRQFGKMEVYFGENREKAENPPAQMLLF